MSSKPNIELGEPKTEDEWADYYRLRYERLREPLGQSAGSERDDPAESSSVHIIAKVDGRVAGAACWVVGLRSGSDPSERQMFVRFRQVAVDSDFEGLGIGGAITRHIEERSREIGAVEVVGNARVENIEYFRGLGYVVQGEGVTMFGTVEHVSMGKRLR
jgi:ribosomal protein S18 acetylase RimI-like enzyme